MKAIDYISETAPYRELLFNKLQGMKTRCNQPSCTEYKNYGGRGIKICDEWNDSKYGFLNFYAWSLSQGFTEDLTIDRINVNGDYEPLNCRYVSAEEQINNKKSTVWIWKDNKPIQLLMYCRSNGINKNEYLKLRRKIIKRKISPMTLEPYPKYKHTKNILIDNREYLNTYCENRSLDYYTVYHIVNIIYPLAETIRRIELDLYITYFYHEPKERKKTPRVSKKQENSIQDVPIYVDNTINLIDYCQYLQLNYRKTYEAIIKEFPYSSIIYLSREDVKEIILRTPNI